MLRPDQSARYARHVLLTGVGVAGQERLLASTARVQGEGRAAAEATLYLVAAGVGRVEVAPPIEAALAERAADMNPDVALVVAPGDGRRLGNLLGATTIVDAPGESRREGAAAALAAVVALSGAAPPYRWQLSPEAP